MIFCADLCKTIMRPQHKIFVGIFLDENILILTVCILAVFKSMVFKELINIFAPLGFSKHVALNKNIIINSMKMLSVIADNQRCVWCKRDVNPV